MKISWENLPGLKVTIMGLGLHGGGLEAARFFARHGSEVTVTDLRDAKILKPSIDKLKEFSIRYVLGRHETADFTNTDLVIKNPAVPWTSHYLEVAQHIETDISIFLALTKSPILAITGSKGKSTTVSALHSVLRRENPKTKLGGNITVSPLSFIDETGPDVPVVLELSSWQLGDIRGKGLLNPEVAAITTILPDHLNRYRSMAEYIDDKRVIYSEQSPENATLCNYDDMYGKEFAQETQGRPFFFSSKPLPQSLQGAFLTETGEGFFRDENGKETKILPEKLMVSGTHMKTNLLTAASTAFIFGTAPETIMAALSTFSGIEHRHEVFEKYNNTVFINDSAATIPEATVAAVKSIEEPVHLITGGTDKELDFSVFREIVRKPEQIYLLEGSATHKIVELLDQYDTSYAGPYNSLRSVCEDVFEKAKPGSVVILSPGCASFGMFLNEFDRGRQFKHIIQSLIKNKT
ncbi:MAG: UDP-N-acetylmuramoyl-L-alanine--D-glutamate ligase [Spirochaetia bacterium]